MWWLERRDRVRVPYPTESDSLTYNLKKIEGCHIGVHEEEALGQVSSLEYLGVTSTSHIPRIVSGRRAAIMDVLNVAE